MLCWGGVLCWCVVVVCCLGVCCLGVPQDPNNHPVYLLSPLLVRFIGEATALSLSLSLSLSLCTLDIPVSATVIKLGPSCFSQC